jgi:hypothetical protein
MGCKPVRPGSTPGVDSFGTWLNLVERLLREQEVAGSNPAVPTTLLTPPRLGGAAFEAAAARFDTWGVNHFAR